MKKLFFLLTAILLWLGSKAQQAEIDSLTKLLPSLPQDTSRVQTYNLLCSLFSDIAEYDTAKSYFDKAIILSDKISDKNGKAKALKLMGNIYIDQGNYIEAMNNYQASLAIYNQTGEKNGIAGCYNNIGNIYNNQSNYPEALKNYLTSLKIREATGNKNGIAICYNNIGNVYSAQKNYSEALKNYLASLKIREAIGDKNGISVSNNNIGNVYIELGDYPLALKHNLVALRVSEEMGNKYSISGCLSNIGVIHQKQGNYSEALKNQFASMKIKEEIGDKYGLSICYSNIGNIYFTQSKYNEARTTINTALKISNEIGDIYGVRDSHHSLAQLDSTIGHWKDAFLHFQLYTLYQDSLVNDDNTKKTISLQMQYEFDKKEATAKTEQDKKDAIAAKELQQQKLVRNGFMGGFAVVLLFAGVFFFQRNKISKGKKRSDELLLNILPAEVAEELKNSGEAEAKQFDNVTVLFTDFVGFTLVSEKLTPKELVAEIHTYFTAFDKIMEKHGLEKIKTIGDAYLAICGLPNADKHHAKKTVLAAMDIIKFINHHETQGGKFNIRVGVNSGSVVAGIVGVKKFAYDIWGDTVNTAARMEQNSMNGKINISESTYQLVKHDFHCIHRGKIKAKNKGEIDMYFVSEL